MQKADLPSTSDLKVTGSHDSGRKEIIGFRSDINGLRALAVTLVTLFHFGIPLFSGGFVGVDVFFVVSGFLMTKIILGKLDNGTFSLLGFYAARAKRIIPALFVLCAILLLVTSAILDPLTYCGVARSTLSSILFVSNFDYAAQGGYFSGDAEANWLLHTWSLSVEWQFYLIYPIALWALSRWQAAWSKRALILGVVAALSFIASACVLMTRSDLLLRMTFYLLPSRAWEMILGGLIVVIPAPTKRHGIIAALGLLAIFAAALLFDDATIWPSYYAALPALGGFLVIWAGDAQAAWTRLPAIRSVGRWSYSIYLWHWPIVAALYYFGEPKTWPFAIGGIASAVFLGFLSFWLVEQKFTTLMFAGTGRKIMRWSIGLSLALLCLAGAAYATFGFERIKLSGVALAQTRKLAAATKDIGYPQTCETIHITKTGLDLCQQGGGGAVQTLVIGDSYAQQFVPRYIALPRGVNDPGITFATKQACAPVPDVELRGSLRNCRISTDEALALAASGKYQRVAIISSWLGAFERKAGDRLRGRVCFASDGRCTTPSDEAVYLRTVRAAFAKLSQRLAQAQAAGATTYLFTSFPHSDEAAPETLARRVYRSQAALADVSMAIAEARARSYYVDGLIFGSFSGTRVTIVDSIGALCTPECPLVTSGNPLYLDVSHMRASLIRDRRLSFMDKILGVPDQSVR